MGKIWREAYMQAGHACEAPLPMCLVFVHREREREWGCAVTEWSSQGGRPRVASAALSQTILRMYPPADRPSILYLQRSRARPACQEERNADRIVETPEHDLEATRAMCTAGGIR